MFREVSEVKEIVEIKAPEWLVKAAAKLAPANKNINIDEPLVNVKKNNQESK